MGRVRGRGVAPGLPPPCRAGAPNPPHQRASWGRAIPRRRDRTLAAACGHTQRRCGARGSAQARSSPAPRPRCSDPCAQATTGGTSEQRHRTRQRTLRSSERVGAVRYPATRSHPRGGAWPHPCAAAARGAEPRRAHPRRPAHVALTPAPRPRPAARRSSATGPANGRYSQRPADDPPVPAANHAQTHRSQQRVEPPLTARDTS
jgi:hypothetical protein